MLEILLYNCKRVVASFGIALRIVQILGFLSMGLSLEVIPLIAYNFSMKLTGKPISLVRFCIESGVLIVGWSLGGVVGIGTLIK